MYRNKKRVGAFFLAFALVFSMIGAAFAYNPKYVTYPKPDEKTGDILEGDFMRAYTRLSGTPIWVLTKFKDQAQVDKLGGVDIAKAINRAREVGVACGDDAGIFDVNGDCNSGFMIAFIERYFHEIGVKGRDIDGCIIDFSFKTDNNVPNFPGSSSSTILDRLTGILYAALEADAASPGMQMSDFSSTTLGEYSKPRKSPDGSPSLNIWPHTADGKGFENDHCKNLGYFLPRDQNVFTGRYCQAANLLMYTGVLKGRGIGLGLMGDEILARGQMVKLLVSLGDNLEQDMTIPEEVRLSASLTMLANDIYLNYKDLDNGAQGISNVIFDGSYSEGKSFEITGTSNTFGQLGTISNSSYGTRPLTFTKEVITKIAREPVTIPSRELVGRRLSDTVYGAITATAFGKTATDNTHTTININITNINPVAQFVAKTDRLKSKCLIVGKIYQINSNCDRMLKNM